MFEMFFGDSGKDSSGHADRRFKVRTFAFIRINPVGKRTSRHVFAGDDNLPFMHVGIEEGYDVRVSARLEPGPRLLPHDLDICLPI